MTGRAAPDAGLRALTGVPRSSSGTAAKSRQDEALDGATSAAGVYGAACNASLPVLVV